MGIDELKKSDYALLKGKNVALFTNQTGRDSDGNLTLSLLIENDNIKLKKVFVPEHGIFTAVPAGKEVDNEKISEKNLDVFLIKNEVKNVEKYKNLPIVSLYGANRKPNKEMLNGINCIVVDIQDIGIRSYTFLSSMIKIMESAAENNIELIILDRPNPLGGLMVDGNTVEEKFKSFVSYLPISYLHACTLGELAKMANEEAWLGQDSKGKKLKVAKLTIIKMKNWERNMSWEDTGLDWIPTSPNIPNVNSIRGCAFTGVIGEVGMMHVGIGTTSPFLYLGLSNIEFSKIEKQIDDLNMQGINLRKTKYMPLFGSVKDKLLEGYYISFDINKCDKLYSNGLLLLSIFDKNSVFSLKNTFDEKENNSIMFNKVCGTDKINNAIQNKKSINEIKNLLESGKKEYLAIRKKYLLY